VRGRVLLVALAALLAPPAAAEAAPEPFGLSCAAQNGVRFCQGNGSTQRVPSFDGVPIDADVTLPPAGDGPFPTLVMLHGYGGNKGSFEASSPEGDNPDNTQTYHYNNVWFAQRGYAVLTHSARGFGNSCGADAGRALSPGCAQGWIHLKDRRFEARDTQFLLGTLVDQGIADPNALGATGISYGGGESFELAYLRDKTQMLDGSFAPWTSPQKQIPLSLKAAWPRWPWSDLVYSLLPNGRFLDFDNTTNDKSRFPLGIPIQTFIEGLYALGATEGYYAPPGVDPRADVTTWHARVAAGDPTDDPLSGQIADEIYGFHQGFGCSGCGTPAPLLIQNGWTDDLFPPGEALRVYNSLRASDPGADVTLQFADLGHQRGQNKANADRHLNDQGTAFLDEHLRGVDGAPAPGSVTAFTQTCPADADAGGPFTAASWPAIHPGAVRFGSAEPQDVPSSGGNPATGQAIDPISGGGACATVDDEDDPGTALYAGRPSSGYTLLGRPTVHAKVEVTGQYAQLDSRLWDLAPDGKRVLVSRGAYRLEESQSGQPIIFQLNGNGWRFEPGHVPQLELLGRDAPYLRPSNAAFSVTVSDVIVELPTLERPGSTRGVVAPTVGTSGGTKPRLRVRVRPRRVRAGKRRRFKFVVRDRQSRRRVRRAVVRFAGKRDRTGRRGRARITRRFRRRGVRNVRVTKRGYRAGRTRVRVVRRR
jgi:fermentation-respiration switch protein FrsA (DUF1100 family)